ncbi:MAG: hypothetical protein A3J83_05700 [Elusimicrobia bacterium RIFOXYA2_FULL_40_6]|nr:MAG: hypothetical protein A3J83_05700 [Elusimicrobia bacterium RIFOXYA2_FULL_40_6]
MKKILTGLLITFLLASAAWALGLTGAIKNKVKALDEKVSEGRSASNRAPVITSLTAGTTTLYNSESTTLTCAAYDPDGDPLTYTWSPNVTGNGRQATLKAWGSYLPIVLTTTCTVTDIYGISTNANIKIIQDVLVSTVVFTSFFCNIGEIRSITPLGAVNPEGGHIFPIDHIYVYFTDTSTAHDIFAPADGTITNIQNEGGEYGIAIKFTDSLKCIIGHMTQIEPGLAAGPVSAGQKLGGNEPWLIGNTEFYVTDYGSKTSFVTPNRYSMNGETTRYCRSPLKYYNDPLSTQLYAKVNRVGEPKDGRVDYDISGRLIGNWFIEGKDINSSSASEQLAFIYDVFISTAMDISFGGLSMTGLYNVQAGAPGFETVSQSDGKISYKLLSVNSGDYGQQKGLMIVELIGENRIRVEVFAGSAGTTADFTPNAKIYDR